MDGLPYLRSVELRRESIPDLGQYPFTLPTIAKLTSLEFHPAVTFIVGENGAGKSTLVEALAVAMGLNSEGGNRNTRFATEATHSELWRFLKPIKSFKRPKDWYFLRAESFYLNFAPPSDVPYQLVQRVFCTALSSSPIK